MLFSYQPRQFILLSHWSRLPAFSHAKTIAGTQQLHSLVPIETSTQEVREYSVSCDFHIKAVQINKVSH